MSDLIAVSDLIGDIYDAALDPALWPLVLERIVQYFKAAAAVLYVQDIHLREGQFYFSYGDDPYFTRLYLEKYARINPLAPHFLVTNVGDVFRAGELIPYEELKETQFFKEWLQPQQYTEFVATTLDKSATSVAFISVTRDITQGFMDDASVERMRVIAPHLRRAVMIGKIVDLRKGRGGQFRECSQWIARCRAARRRPPADRLRQRERHTHDERRKDHQAREGGCASSQ